MLLIIEQHFLRKSDKFIEIQWFEKMADKIIEKNNSNSKKQCFVFSRTEIQYEPKSNRIMDYEINQK